MKIYDKITDFFGNLIKNAHTNRPKDSDKPTIIPNKGYVDEFDTLRDSRYATPEEAAEGKVLEVSTVTHGGLEIGSQVAGMKTRDILEKILYGYKNNSQNRYIEPVIKSFTRIDTTGDKAQGVEDTIQVKFEIDKGSCPGITDIYYTAGNREPVHPYSNAIPESGDELTIQVSPQAAQDDIILVVQFTPITKHIKDVYGNDIPIPEHLDGTKVQTVDKSAVISINACIPILVKQGDVGTLDPQDYMDNQLDTLVKRSGFQYGISSEWDEVRKHAKIPFNMAYNANPQEFLILVPEETQLPKYTLAINDSTDISSALEVLNVTVPLSLRVTGDVPAVQNYRAYRFISGAVSFKTSQLIFVGRYKNE